MSHNKLINYIEPPKDLFRGIVLEIEARCRVAAKIRLLLSSLGTLFSMATFVLALNYAKEIFIESGSYAYLSVIYSDPLFAVSYWQELSLSIAESLPIIEIGLIFTAGFVFLSSIKYIIKNIENVSLKTRLVS